MRLELTNIEKFFGADLLFEKVSGYVDDHEVIGLVGNNGVGKSTFCNIITGHDEEYDGNVHVYPGTKVAYFKQMLEKVGHDEMTVFDYVLHTQQHLLDLEREYHTVLNRLQTEETTTALLNEFGELQENYFNSGAADLLERIEKVLHGLGIYETAELSHAAGKRNITWDMQLQYLSGGERKIVELATVLLNKSANVLILDEPTNHLDMEARAWLEEFIKGFPGSIIIVSHDRHLLNTIANQVWEIDNYTLTTYKGNYDHFERQKKANRDALLHNYEMQKKEKDRLIAILQAFQRNERNGGNYVTVKLYNATKSRLERFEKNMMAEPPKDRAELKLNLTALPPQGYAVLKLEHFSFEFSAEKPIFTDTSITITRSDKVALLGANGIGKSTLLKLILVKYCYQHELDPRLFGVGDFSDRYLSQLKNNDAFYVGPGIKIAYYSQHHNQLPNELTIRELLYQHDIKEEGKFQSIIRRFHFEKDTVDNKKIGDLSGGEKSKLQFLMLTISDANVLLLDEPINHLDIASMKVVEDVLHDFKGAMFVISHDRYFLNRVINKIVYVKNKKVNEFLGTIDEYIATVN